MTYRETIRPPWWLYGVLVLLCLLLCFTFVAAIGGPAAIAVFVVLVVIGGFLLEKRSLSISVDDEYLHVGKMNLARADISQAVPLDSQELTDVAGPQADARALLILRDASTGEGVKVDLRSGDVPYWLISSRHPEQLATAINS